MSNLMVKLGGLLGNAVDQIDGAMDDVQRIIGIIANSILGLVGFLAVFFAIWVGVKLAKADSEDKRKDAKQQLLWTIIGIIGVVVIIILINAWVLPSLKGAADDIS